MNAQDKAALAIVEQWRADLMPERERPSGVLVLTATMGELIDLVTLAAVAARRHALNQARDAVELEGAPLTTLQAITALHISAEQVLLRAIAAEPCSQCGHTYDACNCIGGESDAT